MEKKKTQKEYYTEMVEIFANMERNDLVDFCKGRIALLEKKANSDTMTATQKANEGLKEIILQVLTENGCPMTVGEIQKADSRLSLENGISNPKVTSLLTQLKNNDLVVNTKEKKVSYYSIKKD